MASVRNKGSQTVFFSTQEGVDPQSVNSMMFHLMPKGIYEDVHLRVEHREQNKVTAFQPLSKPWFCIFVHENERQAIKVEFKKEYYEIDVDPTHSTVVVRFHESGIRFSHFAEIIAVDATHYTPTDHRSIFPYDLVLGQCYFDNQGLVEPVFDYSNQIRVKLDDVWNNSLTLRVVPTVPESDSVFVNGGTLFINGNYFDLPDQILQIVEPVTLERQDIVFIDSVGNVGYVIGTDAQPPSLPTLPADTYPIALLNHTEAGSIIHGTYIQHLPLQKNVVLSAGGGGGASGGNVGTTGAGIYKGMSGSVLQFRKLAPSTASSSIINTAVNNTRDTVDITLNESGLSLANLGERSYNSLTSKPTIPTSHTQLTDIGTNAHTAIDAHIADITTNPHWVTKAQVGLDQVTNDKQVKAGITSVNGNIAVFSGIVADAIVDGGTPISGLAFPVSILITDRDGQQPEGA